MSREYPKLPIVAVGAVIVHPDATRVVLVKRGRPPLQGEWSIPGGVLELGETVAEGVVREALEETGLMVAAGEVIGVFDRILLNESEAEAEAEAESEADAGRIRYHYVLIDLLCRVVGGVLRVGGDAAEVRWAAPSEFSVLGLGEEVRKVAEKGLRLAADVFDKG